MKRYYRQGAVRAMREPDPDERLLIAERAYCVRPYAAPIDDPETADLARAFAFEMRADYLMGSGTAARAVWNRHREWALAAWIEAMPGTRPPLFYEFDAPEPRDPAESERAYLKKHKLLTAAEAKRLPKSAGTPKLVVVSK